jgi:hypothetical protein
MLILIDRVEALVVAQQVVAEVDDTVVELAEVEVVVSIVVVVEEVDLCKSNQATSSICILLQTQRL